MLAGVHVARRFHNLVAAIFFLLCLFSPARAQTQNAPRLREVIDLHNSERLHGTTPPDLRRFMDNGRVPDDLRLSGLSLIFKPTSQQASGLKELTRDQQTPGSDRYKGWISPHEYAARYGVNEADLIQTEAWLRSEGFSNFAVNTSRTALAFDGTSGDVERVFGAELHHYARGSEAMLASAAELHIPSALGEIVDTVSGVDGLHSTPKPLRSTAPSSTQWTEARSGKHVLTPADVAQIYDVLPLYKAGVAGRNQRIAVVGQSAVDVSDIARFRAAAGLPSRAPTLVLVPGTGASTRRSGDEFESDVDIEYAGAIAPEADVIFVYTGASQTASFFDALAYAVDQDIAPVISVSYGECEQFLPQSEVRRLEQVLQQANSQGQTVIADSGDQGATGCEDEAARKQGLAFQGLAVQYPASSEYVTAVGGTMFADEADSWSDSSSAEGGSAKGYIPELGWNESESGPQPALLGSGGGFSRLFPKPSWQTAALGGSSRAVPDIALAAGAFHDGYVYCSSDEISGVQAGCRNGFLDAAGVHMSVAGGTSFGAPIVAGLVALLNQMSSESKQGNLNPRLYALAASFPTTFHDIVTGNNKQPCARGSRDCLDGSPIGFSASQGYDPVTGLGTPDAERLVSALADQHSAQPESTRIAISADKAAAGVNIPIQFSVLVSSAAAVPTGTVQFFFDGRKTGSPVFLQHGQASYAWFPSDPGAHSVNVDFVSDSGFASSSASMRFDTPAAVLANVFTLQGAQVSSAASTGAVAQIVVIPSSSYTGLVRFAVTAHDAALIRGGCYAVSQVQRSAPVNIYVARSLEQCSALAKKIAVPIRWLAAPPSSIAKSEPSAFARSAAPHSLDLVLPKGLVALSSMCFIIPAVSRKKRAAFSRILIIGVLAVFSAGCGVTTASESASPGTYRITLTGTDTQNASISTSIDLFLSVP